MRLTDEMKNEISLIHRRVIALHEEFLVNAPVDHVQQSRWNLQHGDDLECYKVKLENFYSETDVKEQTFQDYTTWDYKEQDCFPVTLIR